MIVVASKGGSTSGATRYNENKVQHGDAHLLKAENFPSEKLANESERYRTQVLESYAESNIKISNPCIHFALAFSPTEQMSDELLIKIGSEFMDRMGFSEQPYVQYRHTDTPHPHMHIVSVLVDADGKKVSEDFLYKRCNKHRQELEIKYNLVKAEEQSKDILYERIKPDFSIELGKTETKKAIGSVVRTALDDYKFTSVDSISRFLDSYNVQMNQLKGENSAGKTYRGITFQLKNELGPAGPAIKASQYSFSPTMDRLEYKVKHDQKQIDLNQKGVIGTITQAVSDYQKISNEDFKNSLRFAGIQVLDNGKSLVYVDHQRKMVYDEQALGPAFTRQQLMKDFSPVSEIKFSDAPGVAEKLFGSIPQQGMGNAPQSPLTAPLNTAAGKEQMPQADQAGVNQKPPVVQTVGGSPQQEPNQPLQDNKAADATKGTSKEENSQQGPLIAPVAGIAPGVGANASTGNEKEPTVGQGQTAPASESPKQASNKPILESSAEGAKQPLQQTTTTPSYNAILEPAQPAAPALPQNQKNQPAETPSALPGKKADSPDQPTTPPLTRPTGLTQTVGIAGDKQDRVLTPKEIADLPKEISKLYQDYKKSEGIVYESQLIEKFPYQQLVAKLQASKAIPLPAAMSAVRSFEDYKKEQYPGIKTREESYFQQTASAYLSIAQQMPITTESRLQFLKAAGLERVQLPTGEAALRNITHAGMQRILTPVEERQLLMGESKSVPFTVPLSKNEKAVYLSAASGTSVDNCSYYNINPQQLRLSLPLPLLESVSRQLNENYLNQMMPLVLKNPAVVAEQLLVRGIVVRAEGNGLVAGFHDSPRASFVPIPPALAPHLTPSVLTPYYQKTTEQLNSYIGRNLVQLTQALDMGKESRIDWVVKKAAQQVRDLPAGLSGVPLQTQLRQRLNADPKLTPSLPTTMGTPGAGTVGGQIKIASFNKEKPPVDPTVKGDIPQGQTGKKEDKPLSPSDVIWKDYFKFRNTNGYFYESALLKKPEAFPRTRFVNLLQGEPLKLSPQEAGREVNLFLHERLSKLDKIEAKDIKHFTEVSNGFRDMVSQAPLSVADRLSVFKALHLIPQTAGDDGRQVQLVHDQHKSFSLLLSENHRKQLMKEPLNANRIEKPYIEFPRQERKLYEKVATGKVQTVNPTDKSPVTFGGINGERAKTIISPDDWKKLSPQLNRDSVDALMKIAPIKTAQRITYLHQRGIVLEKAPNGTYKAGHYLTDRSTFQPLSPAQNKALTASNLDVRTQARLSAIPTERGQLMIKLARAIDQPNDKRANSIVNDVIKRAPSLESFAGKPNELLAELTRKSGPLVEKVADTKTAADLKASDDTMVRGLIQDMQQGPAGGGLLDALGEGADTQHMKQKGTPSRPIRRQKLK